MKRLLYMSFYTRKQDDGMIAASLEQVLNMHLQNVGAATGSGNFKSGISLEQHLFQLVFPIP